MKQLAKQLVIFLLPLGLVLAVVNYFGDAANLFTDDYEASIAEFMLQGHHVTRLSEYNDRRLQIELVKRRSVGPNVAIIGSSRSLLLGNHHFYPSTTFNHSVYAAAWFDLESMFNLLRTKGQLPDTLIVGIDPWTFNPNHVHVHTHTWGQYTGQAPHAQQTRPLKRFWERWSNLLSPSYFQASLQEFPKRIKGEAVPLPVRERYNAKRTRCSDGSLTYDTIFGNADSLLVFERVQLFLRGPLYGMKGYDTTDKEGFSAIQEMLLTARDEGVHTVLFFAPVAPQVYARLSNEYPIALLNEQRLRDWAAQERIEVRGRFNPHASEIGIRHFYDGIHMNEIGMAVFFPLRK